MKGEKSEVVRLVMKMNVEENTRSTGITDHKIVGSEDEEDIK